jgi:hypothetical protein
VPTPLTRIGGAAFTVAATAVALFAAGTAHTAPTVQVSLLLGEQAVPVERPGSTLLRR